jgi:hypothetical protein
MDSIKIVRLQSGIDVIGTIEEILSNKFLLTDAMEFDIEYKNGISSVVMQHFLPTSLIEKNEVVLDAKDILFVITPNGDFKEYYQNTVDKLKEMRVEEGSFHEDVKNSMSERIKQILIQSFESLELEESIKH